jgi:hypothetical protein
MNNFLNIIQTLATALEDNLPPLLIAAGVANFDEYIIGPPRESQTSTLAVMFDPDIPFDAYMSKAPVLFYMQLYRKNYEESLKYTSAVFEFVKNFQEANIDFSYTDEITIDIIPIDRESSTLVYITAIYVNPLDSCDD